jgi:hypothetical protein
VGRGCVDVLDLENLGTAERMEAKRAQSNEC